MIGKLWLPFSLYVMEMLLVFPSIKSLIYFRNPCPTRIMNLFCLGAHKSKTFGHGVQE